MKNEIEQQKRKIIEYTKSKVVSIRILANMIDSLTDMVQVKTAKVLLGKRKENIKKIKLN